MRSKVDLSDKDQRNIDQTLVRLIAELNSPAVVREFLEAFFSPAERIVLAKRLAIAVMLEDQKSYTEIQRSLHVSSATVATVADLRKKNGMRKALQQIKVEYWANKLTTRIFTILGRSDE